MSRATPFLLAVAAALGLLAASARNAAPDDPQSLHEKAMRLLLEAERAKPPTRYEKGRAAAELWRKAAEIDKGNLTHEFWAGHAYGVANDKTEMIRSRDRIERESRMPRDPAPIVLDGELWLLFGAPPIGPRPEHAISKFEYVRREHPDFLVEPLKLMLWKARLLWASQRVKAAGSGEAEKAAAYGEAVTQYQKAIVEMAGYPERVDVTRRNLADVYRRQERFKEAEEIWEDLTKRYPNEAVFHYGLATIYAIQAKKNEAVKAWARTVELVDAGQVSPEDASSVADARMRYAMTMYYAGPRDRAIPELTKYAEAHPSEALPRRFLAELYEETDPEKAIEWGEKSLALDPWCDATLQVLLKLYTAARPDPKRASEIRDLRENQQKERHAEMERRKRTRPDGTNGCE
jgi:tetratricopeptide (TPR) repeat protein